MTNPIDLRCLRSIVRMSPLTYHAFSPEIWLYESWRAVPTSNGQGVRMLADGTPMR